MTRYRSLWVEDGGEAYRAQAYARQREGGSSPLRDNPTLDEVAATLRGLGARSVLEVGCGWGRLSAALNGEFDVEGCDVSPQMLALVPLSLPTFRCDIASPDTWTGRSWDAVFTRGVLHYLDGDAVLLSNARRRLAAMGKTVVLWEIPEVCDSFAGCGFVLRPLMRREE